MKIHCYCVGHQTSQFISQLNRNEHMINLMRKIWTKKKKTCHCDAIEWIINKLQHDSDESMSIHNIREKTRVFAPRSILPTATRHAIEWARAYARLACNVHWHRVASAPNNKQSNAIISLKIKTPNEFVIYAHLDGRCKATNDSLRFVNFLKPANDVIRRRDKNFHTYFNFRHALPTSIEQMIISVCMEMNSVCSL